jgi:hypothetical protein
MDVRARWEDLMTSSRKASKPIRRILYCSHCGNRAPQVLIHTQKYLERTWSVSDGKESDPSPWSTFVAVCETCDQILLYENPGDVEEPKFFNRCELIYPKPARLGSAVPPEVAAIYEEASRIKELALMRLLFKYGEH